jgi:dTDP-glucose 4,6-dehydratase
MAGQRKIAVIGSNSFSGSDFIDLLLDDSSNQVIGFSRSPEKSALFLPYKKRETANYEFHQTDMNHDMEKMVRILDDFQPDYIVNFAAQSEVGPSWVHPWQWFETNAVSLAKLIHELKDRSYLKKYVHISSPEIYGTCKGIVTEAYPFNPSTPYAASKAAADHLLAGYAKHYDFPLVTIRATNVYGAHQQLFKIIPRTAIYLKMGKKIQLHGGGKAVKSYIHIRDVSKGELMAMEQGRIGDVYHLSPDQGIAVSDVVKEVCLHAGKSFEDATEVVEERRGQDAAYVIDSAKARQELAWRPGILIDQGLKEVVEWVDEFWDEIVSQPLEYIHKA